MTKTNDQLERLINETNARIDALPSTSRRTPQIRSSQDVNIGAVVPLAAGHGLFWDTTYKAFVNGPAGSAFPLDDGTATYDQQHISVAGEGEMITSVTDDATGATSQVIQTTADTGNAATVIRADDNAGHVASLGVNSLGQINFAGAGITLSIQIGSSSDQAGFFSATPVGQQATPVTLADVIAVLQVFGLVA